MNMHASEKTMDVASKTYKVLDKSELQRFCTALSEKYNLFSPAHTDNQNNFVKVDPEKNSLFDHRDHKLSVKGFFFPQTENLFTFDAKTKKIHGVDEGSARSRTLSILCGVRPCDARAISLLDQVFVDIDPADPYYSKRRDSTVIISLACTDPTQTCFCTSVGCGPDSEIGADVIVFDLEDRLLIKPVTSKGQGIVDDVESQLRSATDHDINEKDRLMHEVRKKIKNDLVIDGVQEKLDDFDAQHWGKISQKCIGCGICTYFCPTCHCFDITDETIEPNGRRVRTWDSCMFSLFTLHASGHNPRPTHKERMRQRIMHKFNYAVKNYDHLFCVGCGRCITQCPVNVDIRMVIKGIMEAQ
jgi:sulfhydrogenase subunit beta (sulfur reductase)